MQISYDIGHRCKNMIGPLIGVVMVFYFTYHALNGERGLMTWWSLTQEIKQAENILMETETRKEQLERRVRLLRPESLDPDMLEEQARRVLNMGRNGDLVILDNDI